MKKLLSGALIAFLSTASVAGAQGVPTVDTRNILQTITQLETMLEDLGIQTDLLDNARNQLTTLQDQFAQLQNIYARFSGARDMLGMTLDGDLNDILSADYSSVIGAIQGLTQGDFTSFGSASRELQTSINSTLSAAGLSQERIQEMAGSSVPAAQRIATQASAGAVVAASAQQTYVSAGQSLGRVEVLLEELAVEGEDNDIKRSVDLNTRMLAEVIVVLSKSLEMQSVEAVYTGQAGVMSAAAIAEERQFMTFSGQ